MGAAWFQQRLPSPTVVDLILWAIVTLVLVLPFAFRRVERNLELFLLAAGSLAVTVSSLWSGPLLQEALRGPIHITLVVLFVGLAFHFGRGLLDSGFELLRRNLPPRILLFVLVLSLGLLSSFLSAIITSLVLVEVIHLLRLDRGQEIRITVLACYAIGLGAVLAPIGEPLSTVATARLKGDFWFLARLLGFYVVPGVLALAVTAAAFPPHRGGDTLYDTDRRRTPADVFWRAARIYAFVAALLLLGTGLSPLVDRYVSKLPAPVLFWVNMISAILDNATLAAAEISPSLSQDQTRAVLLGLLISGGMLIPGNIPNIIAANHLKISSREWGRFAVPVGLVLLAVYFAVWLALR